MKYLYTVLIVLFLSGFVYAEKCPYCGQEILPVMTSEIQVEKDLKNRIVKWTEITKIDEVITQKRVDSYNYYFFTGEVKEVRQKVFDGKDKLFKHKKIMHYKDGRQPVVENISIKEVPK